MTKPKKPEDYKKRGRPSKIDGMDFEMLFRLAQLGVTDEEIAHVLGIATSTVYNLKKSHPDFLEAIKRGKEEADNNVEISLYKRARGYEHDEDKIFLHEGNPVIVPTIKHYPPDPTAIIFWLKNRRPKDWRDKSEADINIKTLPDELIEVIEKAGGVKAIFAAPEKKKKGNKK